MKACPGAGGRNETREGPGRAEEKREACKDPTNEGWERKRRERRRRCAKKKKKKREAQGFFGYAGKKGRGRGRLGSGAKSKLGNACS